MDDRIAAGLAETIQALRSELTAAMRSGHNEALRFELGAAELNVTLAITREASGDAGLRFGVVSFGTKGQAGDQTTHQLSLSLTPVTIDGNGRAASVQVNARTTDEPD
ncbi:hypothetical protein GCM10010277_80140 [Streptomyces longisporoflavus]|uniref:trypco2 family protein n=1 Tax=Streptomyces longisporoflavus TaxID=28044 RepID=UPI00167D4607|nr:trypco2 family protein [Streptomyces longisporoflavus]GGV69790.1 hypothetical protein GCM10010277_80140 [Streptomyces longisporoflavus]